MKARCTVVARIPVNSSRRHQRKSEIQAPVVKSAMKNSGEEEDEKEKEAGANSHDVDPATKNLQNASQTKEQRVVLGNKREQVRKSLKRTQPITKGPAEEESKGNHNVGLENVGDDEDVPIYLARWRPSLQHQKTASQSTGTVLGKRKNLADSANSKRKRDEPEENQMKINPTPPRSRSHAQRASVTKRAADDKEPTVKISQSKSAPRHAASVSHPPVVTQSRPKSSSAVQPKLRRTSDGSPKTPPPQQALQTSGRNQTTIQRSRGTPQKVSVIKVIKPDASPEMRPVVQSSVTTPSQRPGGKTQPSASRPRTQRRSEPTPTHSKGVPKLKRGTRLESTRKTEVSKNGAVALDLTEGQQRSIAVALQSAKRKSAPFRPLTSMSSAGKASTGGVMQTDRQAATPIAPRHMPVRKVPMKPVPQGRTSSRQTLVAPTAAKSPANTAQGPQWSAPMRPASSVQYISTTTPATASQPTRKESLRPPSTPSQIPGSTTAAKTLHLPQTAQRDSSGNLMQRQQVTTNPQRAHLVPKNRASSRAPLPSVPPQPQNTPTLPSAKSSIPQSGSSTLTSLRSSAVQHKMQRVQSLPSQASTPISSAQHVAVSSAQRAQASSPGSGVQRVSGSSGQHAPGPSVQRAPVLNLEKVLELGGQALSGSKAQFAQGSKAQFAQGSKAQFAQGSKTQLGPRSGGMTAGMSGAQLVPGSDAQRVAASGTKLVQGSSTQRLLGSITKQVMEKRTQPPQNQGATDSQAQRANLSRNPGMKSTAHGTLVPNGKHLPAPKSTPRPRRRLSAPVGTDAVGVASRIIREGSINNVSGAGKISQNPQKGTASLPLDILMRSIAESNLRALSKGLTPTHNLISTSSSNLEKRLHRIEEKVNAVGRQSSNIVKEVIASLASAKPKEDVGQTVTNITSKYVNMVRAEIKEMSTSAKERISRELKERIDNDLMPLLLKEVRNPKNINNDTMTTALQDSIEKTVGKSIEEGLAKKKLVQTDGESSVIVAPIPNVPKRSKEELYAANRLPDFRMNEYETVAWRGRKVTASAIVEWMVNGGCRERAPSTERQVPATSEWVKCVTRIALGEVLQRVVRFEDFKGALDSLKLVVPKKESLEVSWLVAGPTPENLGKARLNYRQWEPKLLDFEWESESRVYRHIAKSVLESERALLTHRNRIADPLRFSLRCVELTIQRLSVQKAN